MPSKTSEALALCIGKRQSTPIAERRGLEAGLDSAPERIEVFKLFAGHQSAGGMIVAGLTFSENQYQIQH